jgi:flagellar biosynthesis protein FlhB
VAKRDGRTEAPTPKRRREAKREGRRPRSPDVVPITSLLAVIALGTLVVPKALGTTADVLRRSLGNLGTGMSFSVGPVTTAARRLALAWLPLVGVAMVTGLVASIAQGGLILAPKTARPSLKNLSWKKGAARLNPKQAGPMLVKSVAKVGVIFQAGYGAASDLWAATRAGRRLDETLDRVGAATTTFLWRAIIGLALIAAVDYYISRRKWKAELKMTKQEVRDEAKNAEGDPRVKSTRRRRAYELARRRSLPGIELADVIITNPTHYAVALAYLPGAPAPQVIAKGVNSSAARIRKKAARHGVPIIENRPLARALFRQCKLGTFVPEQLFDDVVKVLVAAYWRRGRFPAHLTGEAVA